MQQPSMRILIRPSSGPGIGCGPVMRMLALAQSSWRLGADVTFACGSLPSGLEQRIRRERFGLETINHSADNDEVTAEMLRIAESVNADWIVTDEQCADEGWREESTDAGFKVLVIGSGDTHRIFESLHHSEKLKTYSADSYRDTDQGQICADSLTGPQYAVLGGQFFEPLVADALVAGRPPVRRTARRLLVTFDGPDDQDLTGRLLRTIGDLHNSRLIVDVVTGLGYSRYKQLDAIKRESSMMVRIHHNADRLASLMFRADLAITSGQLSCYQLACCGVPTIATASNHEQHALVNELRQHGAVVAAADDRHRLLRQIRRLINDADSRQQMSDVGRGLIDGNGPARVVRRLLASKIQFRVATDRDTSQLFSWRNDPEVRSVSFDRKPVEWASHQEWIEEKLSDANCLILIAVSEAGRPWGQVRFEFDPYRQSASLSISMDPSRRGRGLGTVVLEQACREAANRWADLTTVDAIVRPENVAAINMLAKAGFHLSSAVAADGQPARRFEKVLDPAGINSLRRSA